MAPITASTQSRTKLKAFQFEEKENEQGIQIVDPEKENASGGLEETGHIMVPPPPQPLSQRSATKDSRDCPQTPVGRLPLSELLASGEETSRQHLNLTPIERVLWENTPMSSTSPASRRKRKRAHSTSPASSSQNETSAHFAGAKSSIDLHTLQKNLKTPKADPADDLWSRYSLNTATIERRSPTAPTGLGYPHLMHSSSPQTPASHLGRDGAGLRRALSCIEWPTSVAKRRKLLHSSSQGDPMKHDGPRESVERTKMSRVSFLVEKIHDNLSKPINPLHEDESSDPDGSSQAQQADNSPSENTTLDYRESQTAVDDVVKGLSQTAVTPKETGPQPLVLSAEEIAELEQEAESSDFGDDDLDLEMLKSVRTDFEAPPANRHSAPKIDCDEFDDDDNDVSVADLEDVFAKYDSQLPRPEGNKVEEQDEVNANQERRYDTNTSTKLSTVYKFPQAVNVEVLSDDDDEFGDDSDFEQIAAECAAATQKQQISQPQPSVCTSRPITLSK